MLRSGKFSIVRLFFNACCGMRTVSVEQHSSLSPRSSAKQQYGKAKVLLLACGCGLAKGQQIDDTESSPWQQFIQEKCFDSSIDIVFDSGLSTQANYAVLAATTKNSNGRFGLIFNL